MYPFSFKAEAYSNLKQFVSFNSYKWCTYNQEQFSPQQCVAIIWLIRSILRTWNKQKKALAFGKKTNSEFAQALPYSISEESQTDRTSRHLRMKIQVFEGLLLFIICVWVSRVDSLLKHSLLYTFVSSNINSESDISATNSDCIVLQSTSNVQIQAVFSSYELCNVVFASVPQTENVVNMPLPKQRFSCAQCDTTLFSIFAMNIWAKVTLPLKKY